MADDVKITYYGYEKPGDPDWDPGSAAGLGDRQNNLLPGYSVALTQPQRLRLFGTTGKSTGKEFTWDGRTYRDDDSTSEKLTDFRIDVYSPAGPGKQEGLRFGFEKPEENLFGYRALSQSVEDEELQSRLDAEYAQHQREAGESDQPDGKAHPLSLSASKADFPIAPMVSALGQPNTPLTSGDIYDPFYNEPEKIETRPPLEIYRLKFPQFKGKTDQEIIGAMHAEIAPDSDIKKFSAAATSTNGFQAFANFRQQKLSPIAYYKKLNPQFAQFSDDKITQGAYRHFVDNGKINPRIMDEEDFGEIFNPKDGVMHEAFNALKGAGRQSSAELHLWNSDLFGTVDNFSKWFYATMDGVGNWVSPGANVGSKTAQTLRDLSEGWIAQNGAYKSFADFWGAMKGWMDNNAQVQKQQAQVDLARAAQARGAGGYAGRFAGGVGTGVLTSLPAIWSLTAPYRASAVMASLWMGASRYGEAVEAGHENAWLEGIEESGTAGMFRYMINSKAGRLKTAFMNFALNSGEEELQKVFEGHADQTDWGQFTMRSGIDVLQGLLLGHSAERGEFIAPEEPRVTPEPVVETPPDPSTTLFAERFPGPYPNVFARQGFAEELPERAEAAKAQFAGKVWNPYGPTPIEALSPKEVERISRMYEESRTHVPSRGGVPAASVEELRKGIDAQRKGDTKAAADHTDRALSVQSKRKKREVAKEAIETVKAEPKTKTAKQTVAKGETVFQKLYGVLPEKRQSGAIINPFGKPGRHNKFAREEGVSSTSDTLRGEIAEEKGKTAERKFYELQPRGGSHYLLENGKEIARYNDLKTAEAALRMSQEEEAQRRNPREAGAVINPAELISEFFEHTWPDVKRNFPSRYFRDWWRQTYHPEEFGEGAQKMSALSKEQTSRMQMVRRLYPGELARVLGPPPSGVDLRNWWERTLRIDDVLRGTEKVARRRAAFAKYPKAQLKQWLIDHENGQETGIPEIDWLFKFYDEAYAGMAKQEANVDIEYEPRDWYVFHALKSDEERDKYEKWLTALNSTDPRFTHKRTLPTYEEVFKAGFEPASYNPEDLFQMRLNQGSQAMRKVLTLRAAEAEGLAFKTDTPNLSNEVKAWGDTIPSPNKERYYVEPNAQRLLANAWDMESGYRSKMPLFGFIPIPTGPVLSALAGAKGFGSGILLGWSITHPKHIVMMSLAHWMISNERAMLNPKNVFERSMSEGFQRGLNQLMKNTGVSSSVLLDVLHNKRPMSDLSLDDLRNNEHLQMMGLDFGISEERQLEFANRLSEWLPKWRTGLKATDALTKFGYQMLSSAWLRGFFFGELIPRQKMAAALLSRDLILKDHPEYELPQNRMKFAVELDKAGREIEARFGEMNLDNLHWKRFAKDVGTASLLSLGWQLSAVRIYAGAAKDMTGNLMHMRDVFRSNQDPLKRKFLSDRILFWTNYQAASMLTNFVISYINGYSKGKEQEMRDLWFPVIGENPAGSKERWRRASPVEFPREIASVGQHIANHGGGLLGGIYGTSEYLTNKVQPLLSSLSQAFITNKNYFGEEISEPLDGQLQQLFDKTAYVIENSGLPIPWKQAAQTRPGEPELSAEDKVGEFLWASVGFPRAPIWTGKSDFLNLVTATYGRLQGHTKTKEHTEKSTAYNAFKQAIESGDQQKINDAVDKLHAMGVKDATIKGLRRSAEKGVTMEQWMFRTLDPSIQQKLLERATQEEKTEFQPYTRQ